MSRKFNLGRGRPQGDVTSPNTFNFVAQILIFKLELDPGIKKIPRVPALVLNANPSSLFMYESNRETDKNESLADDNTTITMMDMASLRAARLILGDFGKISGLKCNYDKSVIMPSCDIQDFEKREIETLGFQVETKITLLGVEIKNTLDNITEITQKIRNKIVDLISFWDRFRLTLPGRISIVKTCLISQLCYVGCFLPLDTAVIDETQVLLDNFVKINLKISQDRIYLPTNLGGTGTFEIKTFLSALNLSWFNRTNNFCIDNWRYDLRACAYGNNLFLTQADDIDRAQHPILHNIAVNFNDFYSKFSTINGNYKEAYVFKNKAFYFGPEGENLFNEAFFGQGTLTQCENVIRNLKFKHLFVEDRVKSREEMAGEGLFLSAACWMRLQLATISIRTRLRKRDETDQINCCISEFLQGIKKGSKKFRKILCYPKVSVADPASLRITTTFSRVTGTAVPNIEILRMCLSSWNISFLHNEIKDFIFKCRNNQLFTNDRLHAIDGLVNATCTFCRISNIQNAVPESFAHLFFECQIVRAFLRQWCSGMEPVPELDTVNGSNLYWYGSSTLETVENESKYINFLFDCFRFTIWKFRCRKKVPNYPALKRELDFLIHTSLGGSRSFSRKISEINMCSNLIPALG